MTAPFSWMLSVIEDADATPPLMILVTQNSPVPVGFGGMSLKVLMRAHVPVVVVVPSVLQSPVNVPEYVAGPVSLKL